MKELTEKQQQILDYIRKFKDENGYPPTNLEMATHFDCSPNNIADHLKRLVSKGKISITPKIARGIKLIELQS